MKKLIFSVILFFAFSVSFAQLEKGTILLGGRVNISASHYAPGKYNIQNQTSYDLSPAVGYFFTDHFAGGLELNYNHEKSYLNNSDTNNIIVFTDKISGFGVGPFVRYYQKLGDKVALFGHGSFTYSASYSKRLYEDKPSDDYSLESSGFNAAISPGLVFFPVKKFGFQLTAGRIGYDSRKYAHNGDINSKTTNFTIDLGMSSWTVGAFFYL